MYILFCQNKIGIYLKRIKSIVSSRYARIDFIPMAIMMSTSEFNSFEDTKSNIKRVHSTNNPSLKAMLIATSVWCFVFFLSDIICIRTVNSSTKRRKRRPQRRRRLIVKTLIKLFYLWESIVVVKPESLFIFKTGDRNERARSTGVFWEMRGKFYCEAAMCVCIVLLGVENQNGVDSCKGRWWGKDSVYWLSVCWRTNGIFITKPHN